MKEIINNLKLALAVLIGMLPMIIFLDYALDIVMIRDWGLLKSTGFISCMVFYSTIISYHYNSRKGEK